MEGLAAASGVIAVGSFAIQLAETAQKICHFVQNVIGAPKEYARLVSLLNHLKEILRSIANEERDCHEATVFSDSINTLLGSCHEKLKLLEEHIKSIKGIKNGKGRVAKAYAAFKCAYKDRDGHDLEDDIEATVNLMGNVLIAEAKYVADMIFRTLLIFTGSNESGILIALSKNRRAAPRRLSVRRTTSSSKLSESRRKAPR
jgi:hypothetical protein